LGQSDKAIGFCVGNHRRGPLDLQSRFFYLGETVAISQGKKFILEEKLQVLCASGVLEREDKGGVERLACSPHRVFHGSGHHHTVLFAEKIVH
jgi:hypothetical protein